MFLILGVQGCTEAGLQSIPPEPPETYDNLLRVRGEYCTEPSARVVFPVKVLYVIDQSASLQCTDSQNRRFNALTTSVNELRSQPNTEISFVGFSSWSRSVPFTRNRDTMAPFLDPAGGLGPATDYQGSLATALMILEQDLLSESASVRARSRYMVVFVSDGVPEPRCNPGCEDDVRVCADEEDNDGDGRIDAQDDDCADLDDNTLHPDNLYGVCNTSEEIPDDVYVDMSGICPEYNQGPQIMQRIQQILELKEIYGVGDITVSTVLLFSPQEVVESVCPDAGNAFGYRRDEARALLQAMASSGNGTFRDVNLANQEDSFLRFEISSLEAEQTLFAMTARNQHAVQSASGYTPDSDMDGLSDEWEASLFYEVEGKDSDGDRYTDLFEVAMASEGFDALDASQPTLPCSGNRDGDRDGLKDCEEEVLGTDPNQPDSDGDQILDWIEVAAGTNPLVNDGLVDLDFDGLLNWDEIRAGTNPLVSDDDRYRTERIRYELVDKGILEVENPDNGNLEERHCYDFDVSDIQMVVTPLPQERGLNRIYVTSSEGPARISGIPGQVKVACVEGYYLGESIKYPESGIIDLSAEALEFRREELYRFVDRFAACPLFADEALSRDGLEQMVRECMPPKIEVDRRLYLQSELFELAEKYYSPSLTPLLPDAAFRQFVAIQSFDPEAHCQRPWEVERLEHFLDLAEDACWECAGEELVEPDGE